jgi:hypothetical protein
MCRINRNRLLFFGAYDKPCQPGVTDYHRESSNNAIPDGSRVLPQTST